MKITPIEIRQKSFEKKFRGYDVEEVGAFLISLSQEWERIMDDNKELRMRLDNTEREVQKLREVETSLFKTLKTAEDTGANMIEQANKTAELMLRETQVKVEAMINDARNQAKEVIEEAEEKSKNIVFDAQGDMKDLQHQYWELENQRDKILQQMKNIAGDITERVQKYDERKEELKQKKAENDKASVREDASRQVETIVKNVTEQPPLVKPETSSDESAPVASVTRKFFEDINPVGDVEKPSQIIEFEITNPVATGSTEAAAEPSPKEEQKAVDTPSPTEFKPETPKFNSNGSGSFFDQIS